MAYTRTTEVQKTAGSAAGRIVSPIKGSLGTHLLALVCASFLTVYIVGPVNSQRIDEPRIAPVVKSEWTDAQRELLTSYEETNRLYNVFTTMARYPELTRDWLVFGGHVLSRNSLPARDRELLILRIGWLCQSEYEWSRHTIIARGVGISEEEILRITKGPDAKGWSEADATLLRAADELREDAFITDATWNALAERYSEKQMMDVVFTVGEYNLVSMALNSFGVQLDDGVEGFPE